jgi:uncharacterized protein involved in type VI secretion and phage assembly
MEHEFSGVRTEHGRVQHDADADADEDRCRCGVTRARVVQDADPMGAGRVQVEGPWLSGGGLAQAWAPVATLMAGPNRGTWFVPSVGDEVLVAFEGGDPDSPFVVGAVWGAGSPPPSDPDPAKASVVRRIRTGRGVAITMDDSAGTERIEMETPGGQSIRLHDGPSTIELSDGNGNRITMGPAGVEIVTSSKRTLTAASVEIAAGMLTVDAGMSAFSGVVRSDTVITNLVVASSYTPGVGNIW